MKRLFAYLFTLLLFGFSTQALLTGVGVSSSVDVPAVTAGMWYRPAVGATWQWQLQGPINTAYAVDVYDIDLFDAPEPLIETLQQDGRHVICYFSAGSFEPFRPDSGRFLAQDLGKPLEGFSDERWLDVRSERVRQIMLERLDLALQKGCEGVEPDNVDGYLNETGFELTSSDQLAFNLFLANESHRRGLAVALKNDLEQIPELVDYFDFSVNEQCHEFEECGLLVSFIEDDKPVFNAEYASSFVHDVKQRQQLCQASHALGLQTLVLPLALDATFRFSCDP